MIWEGTCGDPQKIDEMGVSICDVEDAGEWKACELGMARFCKMEAKYGNVVGYEKKSAQA
jgi:hypothetical protein